MYVEQNGVSIGNSFIYLSDYSIYLAKNHQINQSLIKPSRSDFVLLECRTQALKTISLLSPKCLVVPEQMHLLLPLFY